MRSHAEFEGMEGSKTAITGKHEAVRMWLLGGFRVAVGDRSIEEDAWHLKKAAALVKLLALAPNHRLHREQVMEVLWPDLGKKAASNNLRQALHAARRIFSSDPAAGSYYLTNEEESLVLCPEGSLWVDVEAFEEAAAIAWRSREPAAYRAAIDLYTGDLLPADRYEEWVESRRQELRQLYLALLVELAGLYGERSEHGPATEALRKATAEEPTLEEAHVGLMRLHATHGRPEQALAQYERLRDLLHGGLGSEPAPATRRLRDEIATGSFPSTPPTDLPREVSSEKGKHNLPAQRTTFVGRERELVEVKRALAMTRLLTLTGAGGSGKTRLALEVARDLVGVYEDGVWLVELAPLFKADLIPQEVAGTLGVPERSGEPLADTLVDALADKRLLLIMDNCEHLVEAAARLVDALLDSCPHLKVLATSREPLGVSGEVVWQVSPLSLPTATDGGTGGKSTVEGLLRYEAVRLFVDRAHLRLPNFELTRENAGAVARVCGKLEGMPLGIELATGRMGALAVEQVAQRLEASLEVLKGTSRSAAPRQRTLRATIDWSHDLLSEAERAMFRRLSVFAGGWTLEAAEAVCSGSSIDRDDVLDLLGALVDKSLVVAGASTGGAVRYGMLELLGHYAREKLEGTGEAVETQNRHAASFLALAEEAEPELTGPQQNLWIERLEREHDNMRAALAWVLERGQADPLGLRLCGAFWRFWYNRGYLSEGVRWLERALAASDPAAVPARVKALEGIGWLTQLKGDTEGAKATYEEMLELSRRLGDKGSLATALNSLGTLAVAEGDNERAKSFLEENLAVLRELEDEGNAATTLTKLHTLNLLGILAINEEGDYARGEALWEESLASARKAEDIERVGAILCNLGYVALLQREFERAKSLCEEALALARDSEGGRAEIIPESLINLGLAAREQGEYARASAFFEEALEVSQEVGAKASVINALEGVAGLAGAVGEDTRAAHLGGLRRRPARLPASLCRPASGHCTSPTSLEPAPGLGRRSGKKRWPRGGRCRSQKPSGMHSPRRRWISPRTPWRSKRRPANRRASSLPARRR